MRFLFPFVALLILCVACEKEAPPEPEPEPKPEPGLQHCSIQIGDSMLVVDVSEEADSLALTTEGRNVISLSRDCISSYSIDSAGWALHLEYANDSVLLVPFLGSLGISEDSILLDPYGRAPLSALVNFTLPVPRRIKLTVHSIDEGPDLVRLFEVENSTCSIPVLGLYADHENLVSLSILDNADVERSHKTFMVQTGELGKIISSRMTVFHNNYEDQDEPKFFSIQNAIYDSRGHIRWYTTYMGAKYFPLAGQLMAIQIHSDKGDPVTVEEDIRIIDLLGEELALYDVPHRNHHEIIEKTPGGNLLVATNAQPYFSMDDDTEDAIVEIDRHSGDVVKFWDLSQIFDPSRERIWTELPNDWCHLNSIQYDSTDNSLLISSKLQCFVSKIDYETGAIRWIFGNHRNWKDDWQPYLLDPENFDTSTHPDQDWTYAQHMPRLSPEGNIIVYDNGRSRPGGDFTRIHEFRVDSVHKTVKTIWTHDFDFSVRTMGSVQVRENGNVIIGHGERGGLLEVSRDGRIIFNASLRTFYRAYPYELY